MRFKKMKKNEIVTLVNQAGFAMGDYNYESTHQHRPEKLLEKVTSIETLEHLFYALGLNMCKARTDNLAFACVWCKIADHKVYVKWCISCDEKTDGETFELYQEVCEKLIDAGNEVYVTNGKRNGNNYGIKLLNEV